MDKRLKYNPELREVSRKNRNEPTHAEKELWDKLLKKDKLGYRFLRQRPIGNFIVDFYCIRLKLAIEVDGEIHRDNTEYDIARTELLNELGDKSYKI